MEKPNPKIANVNGVPIASLGDQERIAGRRNVFPRSIKDKDWHCHDTGLLWLMDSGLLGVRTDQQSVVIAKNTVIYMPPNMIHREKLMGSEVTGWFITIPVKHTGSLPKNFCVLETTALLIALFKRIASWDERKERTPAQERLTLALLDELQTAREADHLCIPFPKRASLRLIAKKIMSNPADMNEVGYWARIAGMSKRSFTRIFSEETGLNFVLWRQRVKTHSALLRLTAGSRVSEVAYDLGYKNISTFIAVFKRQLGFSPRKYLQHQRTLPKNGASNRRR